MPKENAKAQKSNELDGAKFSAAINLIEKEKGIPKAYMLEKITQVPVPACKWDHEGAGDNVTVGADEEVGTVRMFVKKDVVEEVDNLCIEMSLRMAREKLPHAQLGDVIRIEVCTRDFGHTAAQTARQVTIRDMWEAERGIIYGGLPSKGREILTGVVTRVDPRSDAVSLRIGSGSGVIKTFLAPGEQVKGEVYPEGVRLRVYVAEVHRLTKGPQVFISHTHSGLVKRLFELEVPEICNGTTEVKPIAREAGSRIRLATWSVDPDVDPIDVYVGPQGQRVNNIVEELKGEEVDTIKQSEELAEYVTATLSPADVVSVAVREEGKACRVVVPDDQLSLVIGKEGRNARLAAKPMGWKIDIKPAPAPADEESEDEEDVLLDDEAETEE